MRRLLLTAFGLLALCAGSMIAAMIAGGRLQPSWSPYFEHLNLCGDGLLCFWGIMPGNTSMQDAEAILKAQGYIIYDDGYPLYRIHDIKLYLIPDTDNLTVAHISINLNLYNNPIQLGSLLERFGQASMGGHCRYSIIKIFMRVSSQTLDLINQPFLCKTG